MYYKDFIVLKRHQQQKKQKQKTVSSRVKTPARPASNLESFTLSDIKMVFESFGRCIVHQPQCYGVDGLFIVNHTKMMKPTDKCIARARSSVSHSGRLPWSSPTQALRQIMAPLIGKSGRRSQVSARLYSSDPSHEYIESICFRCGKRV
jgi:hypothetical protein